MNNKKEIISFLKDSIGVNEFEILSVEEGFHNRNFIVETDAGEFVVRKQIGNPLGYGGLENERTILEFMESLGLKLMPKSVFYSEENDMHVIEFLEGEEKPIEQADTLDWVKDLYQVHSLDFKDYQEFCDEHKYKTIDVTSPEDILENLESEAESLENGELVEWLKNEIKEFKTSLSFQCEPEPGLAHGDISSSFIQSKEEEYFFDWEFAEFKERPESDLADLFLSDSLSAKKEEKILEKYKEVSERGNGLKEDIQVLKRMKLLMQIAWGLKQEDKLEFCKMQKEKYENLKQS